MHWADYAGTQCVCFLCFSGLLAYTGPLSVTNRILHLWLAACMEASNIRRAPARVICACFDTDLITYSFVSLPPHEEDQLSKWDCRKTIQGLLLQGIWLLRSSYANTVRDLELKAHQGVAVANLMSAKCLEQKTPVWGGKVRLGPTRETVPMKAEPENELSSLG